MLIIDQPTEIDIDTFIRDDYATKIKNGDCEVFWGYFPIAYVDMRSELPELVFTDGGGYFHTAMDIPVKLRVKWVQP